MREPFKKIIGYSVFVAFGIVCLFNAIGYIYRFGRAEFGIAIGHLCIFIHAMLYFLLVKEMLKDYYKQQ